MFKTLKDKFSFVYIGLVMLIALVGSISVFNLVVLQKSVNGLMTDNYMSISAMESARTGLSHEEISIISYLNLDDMGAINSFYDNNEIFQKNVNVELKDLTERGEGDIVNSMNVNYNDFLRQFSQLQNIRNTQGKSAASDFYNSTMKPEIEQIRKDLDNITALNEKAMFHKKDEAAQNAKVSMYTILLISLIAVLGGFFLSRYLVNHFLKPIHLLTDSISKVKAGELNIKLNIKTGDETEKLINEFNGMIQRLSAYEQSTIGTLMDEKNKSVAIVKTISDPLFVLDENYKIIKVNSSWEQFFSLKEEVVLGKHFLESIRNGSLYNFIAESVEKSSANCEKIMYFEKDKGYYFNVIVTQFPNVNDAAKGCVVLMQNVTGFKELERIKTDFVATISHEFKTPLTSIIMGASMLQGGNLGIISDEQMDVVDTIIEDGERLSGFVNELLEVSKLESGSAVYSFEPCSLSAIVENSVRQFTEMASRENVTIDNDIDEKSPLVYADFERMKWVLNNLLSNALKYTKSGDFITISSKLKGNLIEISVKDTGDGIPSAYLDRIFDKFVQVRGHDIEARGTGLGLSVAKEIVKAHGGTISVESEMDAGSNFKFTIPLFQGVLKEVK